MVGVQAEAFQPGAEGVRHLGDLEGDAFGDPLIFGDEHHLEAMGIDAVNISRRDRDLSAPGAPQERDERIFSRAGARRPESMEMDI
ncbi:hypothetical protein GCM10011324_24880 [Allosediminivita pacifica]|nr:hypothetical protein GCM10011324_24880 [Allosediminivita pacifica]